MIYLTYLIDLAREKEMEMETAKAMAKAMEMEMEMGKMKRRSFRCLSKPLKKQSFGWCSENLQVFCIGMMRQHNT